MNRLILSFVYCLRLKVHRTQEVTSLVKVEFCGPGTVEKHVEPYLIMWTENTVTMQYGKQIMPLQCTAIFGNNIKPSN